MSFIVKNTTIINPLDLIAPHSCRGCGRLGSPLCDCCKNHIIKTSQNLCPICKREKSTPICPDHRVLPPIYTLGARKGLLASLIYDYKYNSTRALAQTFAELLDAILPAFSPNTHIVPLPTAHRHIRSRALDHTMKIAKAFAKKRHLELSPILTRAKDTVQVGSDRETRLAQAKEAYAINPAVPIDPTATYILLDDVWTTGASLLSATKKLREAEVFDIIILVITISE